MKRIPKLKSLLLLGGAAVLLGLGGYILHAVQVRRSARALLAQADAAEKRGEIDKAADLISWYLGYRPDDGAAQGRYALLLASDKMATTPAARVQALRALDRALQFAPKRRDVRLKAADMAIGLGLYDAARTHLKTLLVATPADGELEYRLGTCEEASRQFAAAADAYAAAIVHAPAQVEAYARLAELLRQRLDRFDVGADRADSLSKYRGELLRKLGGAAVPKAAADPKEVADRVMDARETKAGLVAANEKSPRAYLERARYRRVYLHDGAGSDADVAHALALAPDDAGVLLAAAESAATHGDRDRARGLLERGRHAYPKDARFYEGLAALERYAGRREQAIAQVEQGIAALPDHIGLKLALAELLVSGTGVQRQRAAKVVDELRGAGVRAEPLNVFRARIDIADGHWSSAAKRLEDVRTRLVNQSELAGLRKQTCLLLGDCYARLGDPDRRTGAYREAAEIFPPGGDPLAATARLRLAAALAAQGQLDDAIAETRKALTLPGATATAQVDLARVLILKNQTRPAPQRRWDEVEGLLAAAERALPDAGSPDIPVLRAEMLAAQGQLDKARDLVRQARDRHPDQVALWIALAALAARRGAPADGLAVLDEAQKRVGDRAALRSTRAQIVVARGGDGVAKALGQLEQGAETFARDDRHALLTGLANAHLRVGDLAGARHLTDRLIHDQPDNLNLRLDQYNLAILANDEAAARQALDALRRLEGDGGAFWRYGQARLLIVQARRTRQSTERAAALKEARTLLAAAATRRPDTAGVIRSQAEIDDLLGNPKGALDGYLRALDLGDRDRTALQRAVAILAAGGQLERADQVLRKFQGAAPLSPDLERLAASVALDTQDDRRALDLAHRAVPADSKDYRDALWLGQVLWISSRRARTAGHTAEADRQLKEADAALQRAVTLAPAEPEVWIFRVAFLNAADRSADARAAIAEARKALPKDRPPLALAACYTAIGDVAQAEAEYKQALAAAPTDPVVVNAVATFYLQRNRIPDAEPLLNTLIKQEAQAPELAAQARRLLAQLQAVRGGRTQAEQAMALLGLSDSAPSDLATTNLADLQAQARVLAVQPDRERRQQAIRALEEVLRRSPAPAGDDVFMLAQLYDRDGDWARARERFQALAASAQKDPRYPVYLAYYAGVLLRRGQVGEAQAWLGKLEAVQPQAPGTIEIKARILEAQGRGQDAAGLLEALARDHADQVGPAAGLLEELDQFAAAEAMYRRFVSESKRPTAPLALAEFYARRDRLKEALDLCEKAWQTCPPEAVAGASVTALFVAPSAGTDDYQQVARRLEEAIRKGPESPALSFDLANVRTLQGRYQDAEAIYRRIPGGASLNNLAWFLALQGGRGAEALELVNRSIASDGPIPNRLDTRALANLARGKAREAIPDLEEAIALEPTADKYFHLARAWAMAGRWNDAKEALRDAQAKGLKVERLHPFERKTYQQLVGELARR